MHLTVYTQPDCRPCDFTKHAFDRQGTPYDVVDLTNDRDARDYVSTGLGYQQTPVVVVRDDTDHVVDHWSGANPGKIKEYRP